MLLGILMQVSSRSLFLQMLSSYTACTWTAKQITDSYNTSLGTGSFGDVYKGTLPGQSPLAVKGYKNSTKKAEFAKEVIVHSEINHKYVVRLLGCCTEELLSNFFVAISNCSDAWSIELLSNFCCDFELFRCLFCLCYI
jgi:serine/threonine protein kinase